MLHVLCRFRGPGSEEEWCVRDLQPKHIVLTCRIRVRWLLGAELILGFVEAVVLFACLFLRIRWFGNPALGARRLIGWVCLGHCRLILSLRVSRNPICLASLQIQMLTRSQNDDLSDASVRVHKAQVRAQVFAVRCSILYGATTKLC